MQCCFRFTEFDYAMQSHFEKNHNSTIKLILSKRNGKLWFWKDSILHVHTGWKKKCFSHRACVWISILISIHIPCDTVPRGIKIIHNHWKNLFIHTLYPYDFWIYVFGQGCLVIDNLKAIKRSTGNVLGIPLAESDILRQLVNIYTAKCF